MEITEDLAVTGLAQDMDAINLWVSLILSKKVIMTSNV